MSRSHPEEGETFGNWLIERVQESTGSAPIFAGDENRTRHIRNQFDEAAGRLVAWAVEQKGYREGYAAGARAQRGADLAALAGSPFALAHNVRLYLEPLPLVMPPQGSQDAS